MCAQTIQCIIKEPIIKTFCLSKHALTNIIMSISVSIRQSINFAGDFGKGAVKKKQSPVYSKL